MKLPTNFQFIIQNIVDVVKSAKIFKGNNLLFKTAISRTNLNPSEEGVSKSCLVKSLKKQINFKLKINYNITGHSFKKTSKNFLL